LVLLLRSGGLLPLRNAVRYRLADGSSQLTRPMISPGCPSAAAGRDHDGDGKGISPCATDTVSGGGSKQDTCVKGDARLRVVRPARSEAQTGGYVGGFNPREAASDVDGAW
jgi:hypothetical protein